jgi:hypothetical protein
MSSFKQFKESEIFRHFEVAFILLFAILSVGVIFANPTQLSTISSRGEEASEVLAQANAMPHQGWALLTTCFSGFCVVYTIWLVLVSRNFYFSPRFTRISEMSNTWIFSLSPFDLMASSNIVRQ